MSTYTFTAEITSKEGTYDIVSGICYGLNQAAAEVDALESLKTKYPDDEYRLVAVQDWLS